MDKSYFEARDSNLSSPVEKDKTQPRNDLGRRLRQLSVDLWLWEVGSLLMSMICVGAIMVILLRYNNQPIPTWNYGLTINGVISVLAVIAKASMILPIAEAISQLKWHWYWRRSRPVMDFQFLDAASRGPWGCFKLLCRPRQWSLATLGALITLGALLMEPSLQLIPSYNAGQADVAVARMPKTTYYKDYLKYGPLLSFKDQRYTASRGMTYAFYNAIFSPSDNSSAIPDLTCPTGNCTWPTYSSLAMCSTCLNVSDVVKFDGKYGDEDFSGEHIWRIGTGFQLPAGQYATATSTNYPLSPKHNFSSTFDQTLYSFVYFRSAPINGGRLWAEPVVSQCVLFFCVKTFSASMTEGKFHENVTSIWPTLDTLPTDQPSFFYSHTAFDEPDTPSSINRTDFNLTPPGQNTTFTVDVFSGVRLQEWLYTLTNALSYDWQDVNDISQYQDMGQYFYEAQLPYDSGHGTMDPYLSSPNPIMDRIATDMTTHMRNIGNRDEAVTGSAFSIVTFVHARWYWAVLPVGLVGLTAVFMAWTILLSIQGGIPVWKSSSIAVMVHGLSEDIGSQVTAKKLDALENNVEHCRMVMDLQKRKWALKGEMP